MALRDVSEADLPILFEHQREPEANEMAAFPARDYDAFMKHWRTNVLANASAKSKVILVDGAIAGNVGSWAQDGKRLVSYWIAKAYWGRGIATAALTELLADHERSRPIYAYVATRNVGSLRVLEKCGFVQAGEPESFGDGSEEVLMQLV